MDEPTIPDRENAEDRCREVLQLWLRWNDAYESLCSELYRAGNDLHTMQTRMDQLDQARSLAVRRSRELLDS